MRFIRKFPQPFFSEPYSGDGPVPRGPVFSDILHVAPSVLLGFALLTGLLIRLTALVFSFLPAFRLSAPRNPCMRGGLPGHLSQPFQANSASAKRTAASALFHALFGAALLCPPSVLLGFALLAGLLIRLLTCHLFTFLATRRLHTLLFAALCFLTLSLFRVATLSLCALGSTTTGSNSKCAQPALNSSAPSIPTALFAVLTTPVTVPAPRRIQPEI